MAEGEIELQLFKEFCILIDEGETHTGDRKLFYWETASTDYDIWYIELLYLNSDKLCIYS